MERQEQEAGPGVLEERPGGGPGHLQVGDRLGADGDSDDPHRDPGGGGHQQVAGGQHGGAHQGAQHSGM